MRLLAIIGMVFSVAGHCAAALELASPFSEHAVLQRDMPMPVWGWANPGQRVTVSLAKDSQTATADKTGRWQVTLPPQKAGGPFTFSAVAGADKIVFTDILIGEVWICSGQSNMQMGRGGMLGVKEMEKEAAGRPLRSMTVPQTVSFKPEKKCGGSWTTSPAGSAVAFAFSLELQKALNVPVGVIVTCWGSSSIEGWMPLDMTEQLPHFKKIMDDFETKDRAKVAGLLEKKKWERSENIYLRTRPNILYNALMHPLAPVACRGLVWYQGEANTRSVETMLQYGESLPLWCQRLRKQWGRDDFHLLGVMLPGFGRNHKGAGADGAPDSRSWAWFRESQLKLTALPHTGIANTVDLGDAKNIHPKDKGPIGKRLALLAQRDVNKTGVVGEGPVYKATKIQGKSVILSFENAVGLKTTDGKPPREFWLAGTDKKWVQAKATITGRTITLTSDLATPKVVRYAFSGVPKVNLVNGADLPALPFRTDSFQP